MSNTLDFSKTKALEIVKNEHCAIKEVHSDNIFTFPEGILGFEDIREYVFLMNEKVAPFMFMQALDDSNLSFVCIEVFKICPEYNIFLPSSTVETLDIKDANDVIVVSLVTVRKEVTETTANLMSPIVINLKNSKAQQVILENSEYPVRFKVWDAIEKSGAAFNAG